MFSGLEFVAYSGLALFVLIVLFHIESIKGDRIFLSTLRTHADRLVVWMQKKLHILTAHVGSGSFRIMMHYCLNTVLLTLRNALKRLEVYLDTLARRNRRAARSIATTQSDSYLSKVAEHKKTVELSPREKVKLKRDKLEE